MKQQTELGSSRCNCGTLLSNLSAHCDGNGVGPKVARVAGVSWNSGDIPSWLCSSSFEPVHDSDLAARKIEQWLLNLCWCIICSPICGNLTIIYGH
jgi:hypothetical protein